MQIWNKKDSPYLREHMVLLLFPASDNVGWCQWRNREQSNKIMIKATLCMRALAWKMLVVEKREKRERFIDRKAVVFPHVTPSKEILDYKPPPNAWNNLFFFSFRVTFKIYLLSLFLGSHWNFFPSLSSWVHWCTVFSSQMGGELAEWNRAAPICTSERFGLAELKQRRACQLSSPSPWHSGIVLHNAFAGSFPSLILNGLSCLHFPCEISPPSSRAHHYEILSNLGGVSYFFFPSPRPPVCW